MSGCRIFTVAFFIVAFAASSSIAASFTVEKAAGSGKIPVAMDKISISGAHASLFRSVLEADLSRSGYFEKASSGASVVLSGSASSQGESLSTSILVSWQGGQFGWSETSHGTREARWQAHRLCDEMTRRIKNKKGMAASRLAFISKGERGGAICLSDSDGHGLVKFQSEEISPISPYFSPDGKYITYTSFLRNYPCVYKVPSSGGKREPLANFPGLNSGGAISPDGNLAAVILSHPGNPELFVLNLSTKKATRLTFSLRGAEASPCWSPDASSIAYVSDEGGTPQIFAIDANAKKPKRISFKGSQNVAPSWGPDGRIAYCSKQGNYKIVVYDPLDGSTKAITEGPFDFEDPSWAPDGRHIVASRRDGATYSLWVLDTEGDPPVRLSLPAGDWRSPEWSAVLR